MYQNDHRIVATLDAGGTSFRFGAMQGCKFITEPVILPSNAHDLDRCMAALTTGFETIFSRLETLPAAISFAFPGPADYQHGIIGGNLPNFPSFREGVALGPYLEERFGVPVFINNDGNLFAYGEAMAGALPQINDRLAEAGSSKRYRNLLGVTIGTGFGCGAVVNGELLLGDNACGGDIWCFRNSRHPEYIVEESVSIRAICRVYAEQSGDTRKLTPKEIADIAEGRSPGDAQAAQNSFAELGRCAGDALATAATIVDGIIVVGGGIFGASRLIVPSLLSEMTRQLGMMSGERFSRMQTVVSDLNDEAAFHRFIENTSVPLQVYGSQRNVMYEAVKQTGLITSLLGTSKAISIGAYIYALNHI